MTNNPRNREEPHRLSIDEGVNNDFKNNHGSDTNSYVNIMSQKTGQMAGTQYVGNIGGQLISKLIENEEQDLTLDEQTKN